MSSQLRSVPLLSQVGPGHRHVRRSSLARRNLTPRDDRVMVIEGLWAHERLLETDAVVEAFFWCPAAAVGSGSERLNRCLSGVVSRAEAAYQITPRTLARIDPAAAAPAMVSLVHLPRWDPSRLFTTSADLVLVADGIEYAGNLGTLLRTVDACGADVMVLTNPVARVTHPKVFAASRGTVLTTPMIEYPSVTAAQEALAAAEFTVYVADPSAAHTYRELTYRRPTAFVVGSEGEGVSDEWHDASFGAVSIPMLGEADSLNVATSAAVLLYEARAQRDRDPADANPVISDMA